MPPPWTAALLAIVELTSVTAPYEKTPPPSSVELQPDTATFVRLSAASVSLIPAPFPDRLPPITARFDRLTVIVDGPLISKMRNVVAADELRWMVICGTPFTRRGPVIANESVICGRADVSVIVAGPPVNNNGSKTMPSAVHGEAFARVIASRSVPGPLSARLYTSNV